MHCMKSGYHQSNARGNFSDLGSRLPHDATACIYQHPFSILSQGDNPIKGI